MRIEMPNFNLDKVAKSSIGNPEDSGKTSCDMLPESTTAQGQDTTITQPYILETSKISVAPLTTTLYTYTKNTLEPTFPTSALEPTATPKLSTTTSNYHEWTIVGGVLSGTALLLVAGGCLAYCSLRDVRRSR